MYNHIKTNIYTRVMQSLPSESFEDLEKNCCFPDHVSVTCNQSVLKTLTLQYVYMWYSYIYIYTHMYIYMCIYTYMHTCIYIYIYVYMISTYIRYPKRIAHFQLLGASPAPTPSNSRDPALFSAADPAAIWEVFKIQWNLWVYRNY